MVSQRLCRVAMMMIAVFFAMSANVSGHRFEDPNGMEIGKIVASNDKDSDFEDLIEYKSDDDDDDDEDDEDSGDEDDGDEDDDDEDSGDEEDDDEDSDDEEDDDDEFYDDDEDSDDEEDDDDEFYDEDDLFLVTAQMQTDTKAKISKPESAVEPDITMDMPTKAEMDGFEDLPEYESESDDDNDTEQVEESQDDEDEFLDDVFIVAAVKDADTGKDASESSDVDADIPKARPTRAELQTTLMALKKLEAQQMIIICLLGTVLMIIVLSQLGSFGSKMVTRYTRKITVTRRCKMHKTPACHPCQNRMKLYVCQLHHTQDCKCPDVQNSFFPNDNNPTTYEDATRFDHSPSYEAATRFDQLPTYTLIKQS